MYMAYMFSLYAVNLKGFHEERPPPKLMFAMFGPQALLLFSRTLGGLFV